jgi:hypothetical protein
MMKRAVLWAALAAAVAISSGTASAEGARTTRPAQAGTLSPKQRGEMAHAFVMRWGTYVQRAYGLDVNSWSKRMVTTFVHADPTNFKRALKRSTLEGAMAELDGHGRNLSDTQVINTLAAQPANAQITPASALDGVEDLVFTPVDPCRIVDTRNTGAGAIAGGTSRGFYAWGFPDFSFQGGSATDCGGLSQQAPQAIVVNVTVVSPAALGYATLYPANAAQVPTAATLIYPSAGAIISNSATVTLGTIDNDDFRIFSEKNAQYVVDIVGYYDFPYAMELDCSNQAASWVVNGSATFNNTLACEAGFTLTGAGCSTTGFNDASWAVNGLFTNAGGQVEAGCAGTNLTASQITVKGTAQCCRIPGR